MAKTINMGGYWTQERLHTAGYAPSPLCTRCGSGAIDNDIHRFWQCPANSLIDSVNISSTQYLTTLASSQHSIDPALWCRGVAVNYLDNPDNMSPKPHQIYHRSPFAVVVGEGGLRVSLVPPFLAKGGNPKTLPLSTLTPETCRPPPCLPRSTKASL